MAGALRLTLVKDVLDRLVARGVLPPGSDGPLFEATLGRLLEGASDWFEVLCARVQEIAAAPDRQAVNAAIQSASARSEAIRYVQLGAPEKIIIGDRIVVDEFVPSDPADNAPLPLGTNGA